MWWYIPAFAALVVGAIFFVMHRITLERRRSAQWDDLHERSKLFSAQLAYLRDAQVNRDAQAAAGTKPK